MRLPLISILILFSTFSYGQAWSGILAPSRAINWVNAGLPTTLPDGETTSNPWTPPTRTQCGSTISPSGNASTDLSNINNALSSCTAGHYVLLGAGTFLIQGNLDIYAANGGSASSSNAGAGGVTLRGSGPQSTEIQLSGSGAIQYGVVWNDGSATWSSGYSVGTTSITMTSPTGPTLKAGALLSLQQCDTGFSGSGCSTGSSADNGGLFICGRNSTCSEQQTAYTPESQVQVVYVTSMTGSGPYTVNFTPGIYMPNFVSGNSPFLTWWSSTSGGSTVVPGGNGLEDLTIYDEGSTANPAISLNYAYASWIKGVRIIGNNGNEAVYIAGKNNLLFNNYLYEEIPSALSGSDGINIEQAGSDNLVLNNICGIGDCLEGAGQDEDDVIAYNYSRDGNTAYYQDTTFQHEAGSAFLLLEGNQIGVIEDDDTWGTHTLNTFFRNDITCGDPPYVIPAGSPRGLVIDSFSRGENAVGNVIGAAGDCTSYQGTSTGNGYAFVYNTDGTDSLTLTSLLRWGNVSTVTQSSDTPANSGVRFVSSEVASSLSGALLSFSNSVPSTDNLPCSFFLAGYASTTCTALPSGGTGLSWWKVCTSWSTFPTSCSATQTQPFPPIGPDVSSGPYVNGHAYDIPAAIAWYYLPVDTSWQNSYTISASSWTSGVETLTVSSLPNTHHLMGPFQFSGVNSACIPTTTPFLSTNPSKEAFMTGSTSTTVQYALTSDPGVSCTGTMKFPDVRQFDEGVYQNDTGGDPTIAPPTGLSAAVAP
jgi:hypothetical protein